MDVHSLRYTSIYSKLRTARRENSFVTFFLFMPLRDDMNDRQEEEKRERRGGCCGG